MRKLTDKQKLFVDLLAADPRLSRTEAARRAGFSAKSATQKASGLLKEPQVKAYYDEQMALVAKKTEDRGDVTRERVIDELAAIAFAEITDVYREDVEGWEVKSVKDIPRHIRPAIQSVKISDTKWGQRVVVTMHSKCEALDQISKVCGHYQKGAGDRIADSLEDLLTRSYGKDGQDHDND